MENNNLINILGELKDKESKIESYKEKKRFI